jgi:hypothetical protein
MVETLDTKWLMFEFSFQYATIPITELKFELTPEFQFFRKIWNRRKKEMDRAVDPTLHTHTHY